MPECRRYKRNLDRMRAVFQEIINDRRAGKSKDSWDGQGDLLGIMLAADVFQGRDYMIIDELFTFFIAGMKTVQVTTTNLLYYVAKDRAVRQNLLDEILPPVEECADDIMEKLDYDTV